LVARTGDRPQLPETRHNGRPGRKNGLKARLPRKKFPEILARRLHFFFFAQHNSERSAIDKVRLASGLQFERTLIKQNDD
jgi:hypothetical protein